MTVRLDSVSTPFPQARLTLRAAIAATAFALAAATGAAHAQGGAAQAGSAATAAIGASAAAAAGASAAPAALPVVGQYTVHPGQSLHDVAVDLTQSHDKAVLARASSALFDANPNAFMKHDPSRLKVGAMLNVPGTPDMASAGAASGVTAASAPAAPATTASAPAAATAPASAATATTSTPNTAAATGATAAAASAVATANAGASAATAATAATASNAASSPATVAGAASEAAGASAPETASASAATATAASAAGASAALASGASGVDQHSFSGSVQAASAASAASAPVSVSSLQQLLALKNRVLMALQHGIGKPAQVAGGANGASGAQHAPAGAQGAQQPEVSPVTLGVVAAIVLAFVALLVRLLMRKRRKPAAAADAPAATETPVAPTAPVAPPAGTEADADVPVLDEPLTLAPTATATATATAAAAAGAAAYAQTHTDADAALDHATDAASLSAAAELGADALPPTLFDKLEPTQAHGPDALREDRAEHGTHPQGVAPGEPETLADATDAASFAAAAELGASALPPEGLAAQRTVGEMDEHARRAEAEPHPIEMTMPGEDATHSETHDQPLATEATEAEGEPAPFAPHAREPQPLELRMPGDPEPEPAAPAEPVVPAVSAEESMPYQEVPQEFPKTAVDALGSIEMSLPPRVEVPDAPAMPDFPFTTEPSATSGATLGQPLPFGQPPAPLAGQAIEAGTAGIGSIAGLGAPRFGTLSLDFDLNLPPDSAEPLPVFSPDQLARIARNKLDLAHEYIALGDLSGARALINEVIESSDHATRADAQALLSTLSPLS
ncbi:FimV/HubP family polar landmark protein [Paraburkholderia tropica]|uniref:FimV/HubP family polar landmark protein n=1 Tax=Paraburkholderia tropica TaxID=92647 RepID=UPI002AB717CD|nr:FimV/HubP family polar landmark protein [Paraburkholderia tropica]